MQKVIELLKKNSDDHYFENGFGRLLLAAEEFDKIVLSGDRVLDIGGTVKNDKWRKLSFEEIFKAVESSISYHSCNRRTIDIKKDALPYKDESFDIVMSHETIEHLWMIKRAGMIDWSGMINFWKESHRILKQGGIFLVSTRNRICPTSIMKLEKGKPAMCSNLRVGESSHLQELGATDFQEIVKLTGLFQNYEIYSRPSRESSRHDLIPAIENLFGRKLKQYELFDTIYFKSPRNFGI